jgi:AGZA family xanthine/uracil permease-like MFS transporter
VAGLTTFLTMSYIVALNPLILKAAGLPTSGIVTATVLAAALGSILMGAVARLPYALAPGMGLNAFFTYELVLRHGATPEQALGLVAWSGILFVVLSLTPFRAEVARSIPPYLRAAVAAGIGLFLAFIGLKNAGLVVDHPVTLVTLGKLDQRHVLFLVGLLVATWLYRKRKPYAFLVAMVATTVLALAWGRPEHLQPQDWATAPATLVQRPDFSLFLKADLSGAFQASLIAPLVTLFFTDLFDSLSTFMGVSQAAGLVDEEGEPLRIEVALTVDAVATLGSGLLGTSPATTYIESTSGIEAGGRTGLTAIVAGLAFLPLMFLSPLVGALPAFATAPVLVIVGALMAKGYGGADRPFEEQLPAFAVLALIPLTFSITTGILWGLILHPVLFFLSGRGREVGGMSWFLGALCFWLLWLDKGLA